MITLERQSHWQNVYQTKGERDVSWFQDVPAISLDLIRATGLGPDSSMIDIGGGASRLVDALVREGFHSLSVLDVSDKAMPNAYEMPCVSVDTSLSVRLRRMGRSDAAVCLSSGMTPLQSARCSAPYSSSLKAAPMSIRHPAAVYSASNSAASNAKRVDLGRTPAFGQERTFSEV